MVHKDKQVSQEKFRTMIGGQALIEGIMMRGPDSDAVVVRKDGQLQIEKKARQKRKKGSFATWPLIRGVVNFFDAQVTGVKALMHSADVVEDEETQEEPSKFDQWLEKKLGNEKFQKVLVGSSVVLGVGLAILLFFLLPMIIGSFFGRWIESNLCLNLIEGLIRMVIFLGYMILISNMKEMRRVFSYHGAEHKTIRCYEAQLPLTVENVRKQTRLHPRCGTSFLLVIMVLSILIFSVASSLLLALVPALGNMRGTFVYNLIMILFKLLLLPVIVSVSYELQHWVGRHDNWLSRILTAPGMWFQHFTTKEPDDSMIEVGIAALEAVLPEEEGADRW